MSESWMVEFATLNDHMTEEQSKERIAEHIKDLAVDGTWAGYESILAVKEILGVNVTVFNPNFAPLEFHCDRGSGKTIKLYYNGINHYDSVWTDEAGKQNMIIETHEVNNEQEIGKSSDGKNTAEIDERSGILNKCYWLSIKGKRMKVRRIIEGKESFLWAISHQLSGIDPGTEEFKELPNALKSDMMQIQKTKDVEPSEASWRIVANVWRRTIRIFRINGEQLKFEPNNKQTTEGEIKLLETSVNEEVQMDSVEIVIEKKTKTRRR